jgi:hypothetical protein
MEIVSQLTRRIIKGVQYIGKIPHLKYCPTKKEGGREGYHSNRFDVLHHRRYFLDTRKGPNSRRKLQKTGSSV